MAVDIGPWVATRNWAADRAGSIHDDATARAQGFPGGLVPGDVHVALLTRVLTDRFGSAWYERGFMRHTFVRAVYNGEELRAVTAPKAPLSGDAQLLEWRLEKRDGEVATAGCAGVGTPGETTAAPWERPDAPLPRPLGDGDPIPHEPIGTRYADREVAVQHDDVDHSLKGNDDSPWYRDESPWGPPVVPTVGPFSLAHRIRTADSPRELLAAMRSGMNAGFEVVHEGPIFYDRPYQRAAWLVEKGVTGRYAFRTIEFTLTDMAANQRVFRGRWRIKWVAGR